MKNTTTTPPMTKPKSARMRRHYTPSTHWQTVDETKNRNKHMCVEFLLDASANLVHSWMQTGRMKSTCRKETNIDVKTAHSHTSQNVYQQRCHYKRIEKAKLCMMACAPHPIYYNLLLSREKRCPKPTNVFELGTSFICVQLSLSISTNQT